MPEIIKAEGGEFEAVLSLIHQGDWRTPLPEQIPIFVDGRMTIANTVASAVPFFDADGWLRVRGRFATTPYAQEVRALVESGEIDAIQELAIQSGSAGCTLISGSFITPAAESNP
jgi:hypothetical protein